MGVCRKGRSSVSYVWCVWFIVHITCMYFPVTYCINVLFLITIDSHIVELLQDNIK
jgi:hypothetical protein